MGGGVVKKKGEYTRDRNESWVRIGIYYIS